jgi:hypothetical protein
MKPLYKILIAVVAVIVLVLAGYFAWELFTRSEPQPDETQGTLGSDLPLALPDQGAPVVPSVGSDPSPLPEDQPQQSSSLSIERLSDSPVFFAWEASTPKDVFYITLDGRIFSAREGPDLLLNAQTSSALNRAESAPDGNRLLVSFGDPRNPEWRIFDVLDRAWHPLPPGLTQATWDVSGNALFAVSRADTGASLVRLDLSKTPPATTTLIADFRVYDISLLSLSSSSLLISELPSALTPGRVWRFDLRTKLISAVIPPAAGQIVTATQDRQAVFVFSSPDRFSVLNRDLQEVTPIIFSTLPQKCGGNARFVYCFVPRGAAQGLLPDSFLTRTSFSDDSLYQVDLAAETIEVLSLDTLSSGTSIDGTNVFVSGTLIYFVNSLDRHLYATHLQ